MTKPKRLERIPWRKIEDLAVILQPKAGQVHEFNEAATYLWGMADGSLTIEEIAHAMVEEFEVDFAEALRDAEDFFTDLEAQQLISLN